VFFQGNIKNLCWHTYKIIFQIETNCLIAFAKVFSISILIKQWLLAGEFGEFEYSPKIRRFWRVRVLAKTAVFRNTRDSPNSPHSPSRFASTRQTRRHSPNRFARTRQTRQHSPSRVARTRQTRKRRVWRVLREFGEFGESGEFGECRLDRFIHIKYVICA
jgi:hypothetical protein